MKLRIREWRQHKALSQLDLATLAGLRRGTIIDIELGRSRPRPKTLRKLARALHVRVEDLGDRPEDVRQPA